MFIGKMCNGVQIVYYNVCPFSRAWMVYFWLLIAFEGLEISWWLGATHWWCWWSFKLISWFLGIKFEGQDEYSLSRWFSNPIWRFLGSQILSTARWGGALDGYNWTTGRDSSISNVLRIWSRGFLGSNFEHHGRWVLGVMMDNWAWFVYSPPPQEMTADQLSGAAGYVDLMIWVWRSFSCICTWDASVFVFAM